MAMKIRKGDRVKVIAGRSKGKIGDVLRVLPTESRVVVSGVNVIKRHTKPNRTDFVIRFNGVSMPVQLDGEPGGVFKECVPVVVSGRVDNASNVFLGDSVLVKHDNNYDSANKDRVAKAKAEADRCSAQA